MLKISELTRRDIVNLADGAKLGAIKDIQLDPETGAIKAFVLQSPRKYGLLHVGKDMVVPWENIKKIGLHTILVELHTV